MKTKEGKKQDIDQMRLFEGIEAGQRMLKAMHKLKA
jgi:hypothetical protein